MIGLHAKRIYGKIAADGEIDNQGFTAQLTQGLARLYSVHALHQNIQKNNIRLMRFIFQHKAELVAACKFPDADRNITPARNTADERAISIQVARIIVAQINLYHNCPPVFVPEKRAFVPEINHSRPILA